MALIEDLYKQATGLLSSANERMKPMLQDDPLSTDLESPNVSTGGIVPSTLGSQSRPQNPPGTIVDPTGKYTLDPNTGKRIYLNQGQPSNQMIPPEKPNDIKEIAKNPGLFQRIFGMDTKTFGKNWKEKGGYEGLMANPGFLLGLGIIQSSAQGKPIGSDIFDIATKSGAISAQYADRIKARQKVLAPVSDAQRDEVRSVLAESNIYESSIGQKIKGFLKGKNTEAMNRRALDDIYQRAEQMMKADAKKFGGRAVRTRREYIEDAVKQLQAEQKIETSEKGILGWLFGRGVQSKAKGLAEGGPAKEGKEYIVGEEGPEMFVPEVDGNVIKNDDAKIINMLLESNPQLKNVSRARAVKILKARFPDYF